MFKCKKCGFLKYTYNTTCLCNVKKINETKFTKKKDKKPIKQTSDKKKERIQNTGGELKMFGDKYKGLLKKGENACSICKQPVSEEEVQPACFPHILPKGTYPEFRTFKNNVGFVCSIECHQLFDSRVNKLKEDIGLERLIKDISNGNYINI